MMNGVHKLLVVLCIIIFAIASTEAPGKSHKVIGYFWLINRNHWYNISLKLFCKIINLKNCVRMDIVDLKLALFFALAAEAATKTDTPFKKFILLVKPLKTILYLVNRFFRILWVCKITTLNLKSFDWDITSNKLDIKLDCPILRYTIGEKRVSK